MEESIKIYEYSKVTVRMKKNKQWTESGNVEEWKYGNKDHLMILVDLRGHYFSEQCDDKRIWVR